jgi:hypothetical protein
MSLDFSYAKCKNVELVSTNPCNKDEWHPVGNALVWASIPCGFNRIDEKNVDHVWARINAYQHLGGALLKSATTGPIWLTRDDIVKYIGLTTNASPKGDLEFWRLMCRFSAEGRDEPRKSAFDSIAEMARNEEEAL